MFNWDSMYMAVAIRDNDLWALFNVYRPLACFPYYLLCSGAGAAGMAHQTLLLNTTWNAVLAALAMGALFALLADLSRDRWLSLASTLLVAFSMGFWFHAESAKTYPFSTLVMVGALAAFVRWSRDPENVQKRGLLAVAAATAVLAHGTLITLAAALAIGVYRRGGRGAAVAVALQSLGWFAGGFLFMFWISLANRPDLSTASAAGFWYADFQRRRLFDKDLPWLLTRLPQMIGGSRDPSGEILGMSVLPEPQLWAVGVGTLLVLAAMAWMARRSRHDLALVLWLFLLGHLLLLWDMDTHNENLLAALLPLWAMPSLALTGASRGRLFWRGTLLALAVALGVWNYGNYILPNRIAHENPFMERALFFKKIIKGRDLLVSRVSKGATYLQYFLDTPLIVMDPSIPGSLQAARARILTAFETRDRVLLDPIVQDYSDEWSTNPLEIDEQVFKGISGREYMRVPGGASIIQLFKAGDRPPDPKPGT